MSEKLTKQLKDTNKQVEDISKSRLGSAYKGFIQIPTKLFFEPTTDTFNLSDSVTRNLVTIAPSGNPLPYINLYTSSDLQNGVTGNYTMNDLGTFFSTYNMKEWYYSQVNAEDLFRTVNFVHIKGVNASTKSYQDVVVLTPDRNNTATSFKLIHRTVVDNGSTVTISFTPPWTGVYFVGIYSDTYTYTSGGLSIPGATAKYSQFIRGLTDMYTLTSSNSAYCLGDDDVPLDPMNMVHVNTANPAVSAYLGGPSFSTNPNHDIFGVTDNALAEKFTSASERDIWETPCLTQANGDLFYVNLTYYNTPKLQLLVPYDLAAGTQYRTLSSVGAWGAWTNFTGPKTVLANVKGVLITGADKSKVRVLSYGTDYVNGGCAGYTFVKAIDTNGYTGKRFMFSYIEGKSQDYYIVSKNEAGNPTCTFKKYTALGSSTTMTGSAYKTGVGYGLYRVDIKPANDTENYVIESSDDIMLIYVPFYVTSDFTGPRDFSAYLSKIPSVDGNDYGTEFRFRYSGFKHKATSFTNLPKVYVHPIYANTAVSIIGATTTNMNIAPNRGWTAVYDATNDDRAIKITSDKPIVVMIGIDDYTWNPQTVGTAYGNKTYYCSGRSLMPNMLVAGASSVSVNTSPKSYVKMAPSNSTAITWERAYKVTTDLLTTGVISWLEQNLKPFRTSTVTIQVSFSADNTTWSTWETVTSGQKLPQAYTAGKSYIKIRITVPVDASSVSGVNDDYWISNIKVIGG